MASPITGLSSEEHGSAVGGGMAAAKEVKARYLAALTAGEATFRAVVELSRDETSELRYLSKLRLYDILRDRRGWSDATALDVLVRNGFTQRDNLASIRRSARKIELFEDVLKSTADRWRARPAMPEGWPWSGKLTLLLAELEAPLPVELGGAGKLPPAPQRVSAVAVEESDEESGVPAEETRDELSDWLDTPLDDDLEELLNG